jgi:conserved hypothetical protein, YceG family
MKAKKLIIRLLFAAVIICALLGLSYYQLFQKSNVKTDDGNAAEIKIYRSYEYDDLLKSLTESGTVINIHNFTRAARLMHLEDNFKPGFYKLKNGMNNKSIVRTLAKGWQTPVRLVIPGYIRDMDRMSSILGEKLEADSSLFRQVLDDQLLMESYGFDKENFIGMFIPNTYEFYWTVTPTEFVERMNKEYEKFWSGGRDEKAAEIGLTRKQVSTLASIVIEESKYEPEFKRIAGVYMNRLNMDMPLQADPTVKFAVGDPGLKRILDKHLTIDSPYNTYLYKGLPPGPITMPTVSAIDAVLDYEHHDYLYFCAKPTFDGQHAFAKTLSQHSLNAAAYHRAFRERERSSANQQ